MKHLSAEKTNVYINNLGHMAKISTKLGMKFLCFKYYNEYINHDPAMTFTYFTARSVLETLSFTWGKKENYGFSENYCSLRPEKW